MSDTPETDAMCICTHHKSFAAIGGVVNPDFARRLERERDELRERVKELIHENENLYRRLESVGDGIFVLCRKLKAENEKLKQQQQ